MKTTKAYLIMLILILSACTRPVIKPIRIAANIWPGYEPLFWAAHKNYLDPERFHLVESPSSTEVIRAFRSGIVEGAALTLDEVIALAANGFDPKIVILADYSKGADVIIAKQKYKSMSQLKGKRIGVEETALGQYFLSRALSINKIKLGEVTKVYMEFDKHVEAFKNNLVDAIVTFEPARGKILELKGNIIFDSSQIPYEIIDVIILNGKIINEMPEAPEILAQGWAKALADINNPEQTQLFSFMAQREQTSVSLIHHALKLLSFVGPEENETLTKKSAKIRGSLKTLVEYMQSSGTIRGEVNIDKLFIE